MQTATDTLSEFKGLYIARVCGSVV